ncbi:hypothetical protein HDC35_000832 [Sphingopyxis sp. JAI128]|nr:hypothetical protein [Sphingopyxis sp. JAI128]
MLLISNETVGSILADTNPRKVTNIRAASSVIAPGDKAAPAAKAAGRTQRSIFRSCNRSSQPWPNHEGRS